MSFLIRIDNGRVSLNQTLVHVSKSCKRLFSFPLERVESYPTKFKCMTVNLANIFSYFHMQEGDLPSQTPVHDSKCCKRLFSFPLARRESYPTKLQCITKCCKRLFSFSLAMGESYPTKLQCMTPIVANVFSHSH